MAYSYFATGVVLLIFAGNLDVHTQPFAFAVNVICAVLWLHLWKHEGRR